MVYYLIQGFSKNEDIQFKTHIYPTYLTSYKEINSPKEVMLQAGLADALKFTEKSEAENWMKTAVNTFNNKEFHIIIVDSAMFGRAKPKYIIGNTPNESYEVTVLGETSSVFNISLNPQEKEIIDNFLTLMNKNVSSCDKLEIIIQNTK